MLRCPDCGEQHVVPVLLRACPALRAGSDAPCGKCDACMNAIPEELTA